MSSSPEGSTLRPGQRASEPATTDRPAVHLPTIGHFGPYEIAGRLALGGMAEILLARERIEGAGSRYLVVKRILQQYETDEDFVDMFFDEARVAIRLSHPNICHIYKFGQVDGTPYIAMEWVNGEALGRVIRRAREHGGIPIPIVCHVIARIAEALEHAHNATDENGAPLDLVHRDVSPHNIMMSYDGSVKLLDFGIAKASTAVHKTQGGVLKGKFAYMAPEQIEGQMIDGRTDVFALGVCLWEALTGRPLYHRDSEMETMRAIGLEPVPPLRGSRRFDPELDAICQKALAKAPSERFRSAREMQEALVRYLTRHQHSVSAGNVAEMMIKLFRAEIERGPSVDTTPFGSSYHSDVEHAALQQELRDSRSGDRPDGAPALDYDVGGLELDADPHPAATAGRLSAASGGARELAPADPPTAAGDPALDVAALAGERRRARGTRPRPPARPARGAVGLPGWIKGAIAVGLLAVLGVAGWALYPRLFPEPVEEQAPVLADRPGTASLMVQSDPAGAVLFVDGDQVGRTPFRAGDLEPGTHTVELRHPGFESWSAEVDVSADDARTVEATLLERAPPPADAPRGWLTLESTPPADVYAYGEHLGRTPIRRARVPAGLVDLRIEVDGVRLYKRVMVREGEETPTHLDLREDIQRLE